MKDFPERNSDSLSIELASAQRSSSTTSFRSHSLSDESSSVFSKSDSGKLDMVREIPGIKQTRDGMLREVPLFNVETGQLIGTNVLLDAAKSLTKVN